NHDLESAVDERRFREDLFYRINVIHIGLPPLRARGNDILLLAQHFIETFAPLAGKTVTGLSAAAAEKLLAYHWPGNVRGVKNCIERAVAVTRFEQIAVEDLPEKIRDYRQSHVIVASDDASDLVTMEEVERRYILRVLQAVAGNKTLAAQILGFDRKTLYRKLERFGAAGEKATPTTTMTTPNDEYRSLGRGLGSSGRRGLLPHEAKGHVPNYIESHDSRGLAGHGRCSGLVH